MFADRNLRRKLTSITNKYIMLEILKEIFFYFFKKKESHVILDAPLLFETKILEYFCYPIMVVFVSD